MSVDRIHTLGPVQLFTDAMGAAVLIGGITQQALPTGTEVRSEPSSGDPYPSHQAIVAQKPTASFTSYHLATILDTLGVAGLPIFSATNYGLRMYAQKYTEGSTPASGSVHRMYTIRQGLIVPTRLSCSHQGDATLEVAVISTYDGTNDPLVITDTVAMPSGLTDAERFTLGNVTFGGISLPQVTGVDITFGLGTRSTGSNSDIWDTHCSIRTVRPSITLRGIDIEWFKSSVITLAGKAGTHLNSSVYFRKRAVGGSFVADATSEHIKFTACGLAYIDQAFSASTNEDAEPSVTIPLRYDGTNYPLIVDTTSALS